MSVHMGTKTPPVAVPDIVGSVMIGIGDASLEGEIEAFTEELLDMKGIAPGERRLRGRGCIAVLGDDGEEIGHRSGRRPSGKNEATAGAADAGKLGGGLSLVQGEHHAEG
jgi:hypothetical protein